MNLSTHHDGQQHSYHKFRPAQMDIYYSSMTSAHSPRGCDLPLLLHPVDEDVKLLIIKAQPPLDCSTFGGRVHIIPYGIPHLGIPHLHVVVRSLSFVGTEGSRVALVEQSPIFNGSWR